LPRLSNVERLASRSATQAILWLSALVKVSARSKINALSAITDSAIMRQACNISIVCKPITEAA
jgi:hypothetical protein